MRANADDATVTDERVLDAIVELCGSYRAPSTGLIATRLAGDGRITARFRSAVSASLERLHTEGRVACIVQRGIDRWSA